MTKFSGVGWMSSLRGYKSPSGRGAGDMGTPNVNGGPRPTLWDDTPASRAHGVRRSTGPDALGGKPRRDWRWETPNPDDVVSSGYGQLRPSRMHVGDGTVQVTPLRSGHQRQRARRRQRRRSDSSRSSSGAGSDPGGERRGSSTRSGRSPTRRTAWRGSGTMAHSAPRLVPLRTRSAHVMRRTSSGSRRAHTAQARRSWRRLGGSGEGIRTTGQRGADDPTRKHQRIWQLLRRVKSAKSLASHGALGGGGAGSPPRVDTSSRFDASFNSVNDHSRSPRNNGSPRPESVWERLRVVSPRGLDSVTEARRRRMRIKVRVAAGVARCGIVADAAMWVMVV